MFGVAGRNISLLRFISNYALCFLFLWSMSLNQTSELSYCTVRAYFFMRRSLHFFQSSVNSKQTMSHDRRYKVEPHRAAKVKSGAVGIYSAVLL